MSGEHRSGAGNCTARYFTTNSMWLLILKFKVSDYQGVVRTEVYKRVKGVKYTVTEGDLTLVNTVQYIADVL